MECLRSVQHPVFGDTRPGFVFSPFSVCFREPDLEFKSRDRVTGVFYESAPPEAPPEARKWIRQAPNNGKCEDGVTRRVRRWTPKRDQIVDTAYPEFQSVIDKGAETKDTSDSKYGKGEDCSDCGPRCYMEHTMLKLACFHGTSQFLRRTSTGESEVAPLSSLTPGDDVLVWDSVVGAPFWSPLSLFWLRPASGLGQQEPASGGQQGTTSCATREDTFVNITYEHVGSGEQHHLVVTSSHYVGIRCNDDLSNHTLKLGMASTDSCVELAGDVGVGAVLVVWLQGNEAIGEATVVAIDTFMEAMAAYLPLTSSSLQYVLAGG